MRRIRHALVLGLGAAALLVPSGTAFAHEQDLPGAACNQGTMTAHGMIPPGNPAHDNVPHGTAEHCGHAQA